MLCLMLVLINQHHVIKVYMNKVQAPFISLYYEELFNQTGKTLMYFLYIPRESNMTPSSPPHPPPPPQKKIPQKNNNKNSNNKNDHFFYRYICCKICNAGSLMKHLKYSLGMAENVYLDVKYNTNNFARL